MTPCARKLASMSPRRAAAHAEDLSYGGPHDPGADAAADRGERVAEAARRPLKVEGSTVRIGTASWTDPTMTARGVFYPPDATSAEDRLVYYPSQFPIVEG